MTYDLKADLQAAILELQQQSADALAGRVGDLSPRHAELEAFMRTKLGRRPGTAAITAAIIAEIATENAKRKP